MCEYYGKQKDENAYNDKEYVIAFNQYERRAERLLTIENALLSVTDPEVGGNLDTIIGNINTVHPSDTSSQIELLCELYRVWNHLLAGVEKEHYMDETPHVDFKDTDTWENAAIVVLGGKLGAELGGLGDELANILFNNCPYSTTIMTHARGPIGPSGDIMMAERQSRYCRYTDDSNDADSDDKGGPIYKHYQSLEALLLNVKETRDMYEKIVFVYTIGVTGANGECTVNNDLVGNFLKGCTDNGLLTDPKVKIVHTSSFHVSPKSAGYEDNIAENYGLCDYGASKILQTMQIIEALYKENEAARDSQAFADLTDHMNNLKRVLGEARDHWENHPEDAKSMTCPVIFAEKYKELVDVSSGASHNLFSDTSGDMSIIHRLRATADCFDVVKIPYMLSNTAIYKRLFVFDPRNRIDGQSAWDFYKSCSLKRMRIVITPFKGAMWHADSIERLIKTKKRCMK